MFYRKSSLPSMRALRRLADMAGPFPTQAHHIVMAAQRLWFDDRVVDFVQCFSRNEGFHSREEFIERCEDLRSELLEERYETAARPRHLY